MNWLWRLINERRAHQLELLRLKNEHELEMKVCHSCETLKTQLEAQNILIRELTKKPEPIEIPIETHQPIRPKHKPWSVVQQQLEREDRKMAAKLKEEITKQPLTADDIERELEGVQNASRLQ